MLAWYSRRAAPKLVFDHHAWPWAGIAALNR